MNLLHFMSLDACRSCYRPIQMDQAFFCGDECRDQKIMETIRERPWVMYFPPEEAE